MYSCQLRKALFKRNGLTTFASFRKTLQFPKLSVARSNQSDAYTSQEPVEYQPNSKPLIDEWMQAIGNTPVVQLEPGICVKLEGYNPSGSYKDRALTSIFMNHFETGALKKSDSTLCIVTSGSAGRSLAMLCQSVSSASGEDIFDLELNIIMPLAYAEKSNPLSIIGLGGVRVFYGGYQEYFDHVKNEEGRFSLGERKATVNIIFDDQDFKETVKRAKIVASECGWVVADQHYDCSGMHAQGGMAKELMTQVPNLTDVVCATGSGAAVAGLRRYLPSYVNVHSRPAISGTIEGLTDIRDYDNFCKSEKIVGYDKGYFKEEDAINFSDKLLSKHGVEAGLSTGSCYWLAKSLMKDGSLSSRKVAFISADGVQKRDQGVCEVIGKVSPGIGNRRLFSTAAAVIGNHHARKTKGYIGMKMKRLFSTLQSSSQHPNYVDHIVIGGGPVGTATAWKLSEKLAEKSNKSSESIMLVHEPTNHGAHEDWSRLARLSFDGDYNELALSKHALGLLDLVNEVQSFQSGPPVIPLKPGMLFVASPCTQLAEACMNAESSFNELEFARRKPEDLDQLFPGNSFNLPKDTLCWTHPQGYCVSPIELCSAQLKTAKAYGVDVKEGTASIDIDLDMVKVSLESGESFLTKKCYVFAGAQNKEIFEKSLQRSNANSKLTIPEFENTYITAISTVRYNHIKPQKEEGDVATPIVLGQLDVPDILDFQANFSIIPEEYGNVLKTRLSGSIGSEVIPTVSQLHGIFGESEDNEMKIIYKSFFGKLFPLLDTSKPLDFNRCVTYRNHGAEFSGTSLLEKKFGREGDGASIMTTVGCFGVGVKFGPALGEAAALHALGEDRDQQHSGIDVHQSGDEGLLEVAFDAEARAY